MNPLLVVLAITLIGSFISSALIDKFTIFNTREKCEMHDWWTLSNEQGEHSKMVCLNCDKEAGIE